MTHFDRVIPLLVYDDLVAAHDFLVEAFGFEPGGVDNEPNDQPYGQREYGVRDLEGHRWWFATPVKELHSIA